MVSDNADRADRAGRWDLDAGRSTVTLTHKTMWGLVNVRGSLGGLSGHGAVGPDGGLSGILSIDPATIDTKNKKRDEHLRSADFFEVATHPSITYTVSGGAFGPDGTLVLNGTLQVAGIDRPFPIAARISGETASDATLTADLTIDRADFGLTWNKAGMLKGPATLRVAAHFTKSAG
jgi:polyisoprenoid-binding protein YceI